MLGRCMHVERAQQQLNLVAACRCCGVAVPSLLPVVVCEVWQAFDSSVAPCWLRVEWAGACCCGGLKLLTPPTPLQ